jgi:hypothetical protein
MKALLKSRKFLLLCLDAGLTLLLYFVGKYFAIAIEDIKLMILVLQPVFVMIIGSIAYEDAAAMAAGIHPGS